MFPAPTPQIYHKDLGLKTFNSVLSLKGLNSVACYLKLSGPALCSRNRMQAADVNHTCNFKFSSSHIKKVERKGEIDFHNTIYIEISKMLCKHIIG